MSFGAAPTRRWTEAEVRRMVEAGILAEDAPYELLAGELVEKSPQGPVHAVLANGLASRLTRALPEGWHVRSQSPIRVDAESVPDADVAVVRSDGRDYLTAHPSGPDTALVVEVAVTSLAVDRAKLALYAAGGAPVVWLVDVASRRIEAHSGPGPHGYRHVDLLGDGDEAEVPVLGVRWAVSELLP